MQPTRAGPAPSSRPRPPPPPCHLPPLAPKQLGGERRCRLGHLLPPCLPPLLPGDATRPPRPSLTLPCLSLRPYPPLISLPPVTKRSPSPPTSARAAAAIPKPLRHALALHRSSLVLLVVSRDQRSPGAPPRCFPPPRPPEIRLAVPLAPTLPRPRRLHRPTPRELLFLLPLVTLLELPPNPVGHHSRELGSAGHVAVMATDA